MNAYNYLLGISLNDNLLRMLYTFYKSLFAIVFLPVTLLLTPGCEQSDGLPDPLEAGWNGQPVCEVLEDDSHVRLLRCTFPPGVGHERHYHNAHTGYTISGSTMRITDTTGTREVNVPTGSSFSNDAIEWHEVLNVGDSTAIFLIIEHK